MAQLRLAARPLNSVNQFRKCTRNRLEFNIIKLNTDKIDWRISWEESWRGFKSNKTSSKFEYWGRWEVTHIWTHFWCTLLILISSDCIFFMAYINLHTRTWASSKSLESFKLRLLDKVSVDNSNWYPRQLKIFNIKFWVLYQVLAKEFIRFCPWQRSTISKPAYQPNFLGNYQGKQLLTKYIFRHNQEF